MTNPVTEAWIQQQAKQQAEARARYEANMRRQLFEERLGTAKTILVRVVMTVVAAALSYAVFPGSGVFTKGLASLTLADLGFLASSAGFAFVAFRALIGE